MTPRAGTSPLARAVAVALLVLGFLPLVDWLPGGRAWPDYDRLINELLLGSVITLGAGLVLHLLTRARPDLWPGVWAPRVAERAARIRGWKWWLGAGAFALYALIARAVFDGRPLLIDEIVQVWQGRLLAAGHLTVPTPSFPEFYSVTHIIDQAGRSYGQFPIGGPLFFALGTLLHAEWLVGPALGALGVVLFATLLEGSKDGATLPFWGALLFAVTPFWAFQAGSHMNHVPTVTCLLAGMVALQALLREGSGWRSAFAMGAAFGMAGAVRPTDGLAFGLPAFLWLAWRVVRGRSRPALLVAAVAGGLLPALLVAWANWRTTGSPFLFGYTAAWGADHGLGFHAAPWGPRHTPMAGLELLNLYALRLQSYLFETPFPALLPAIVAFWWARRLEAFDRYLLAAAGLVAATYFAYWHDGLYLGPRFMLPLVPMLVLWSIRAPGALLDGIGDTPPVRVALWGAVAAVPLTLALGLPPRVRSYHHQLQVARWDADADAARAGVTGALVFVKESWGAQLIVRIRAAGVSRSRAEVLYHRIDACALEQALTALEHSGVRDSAADSALGVLMADSARLVPSPASPDSSERFLPGSSYTPLCVARVAEDRAGFTVHTPLILAGRASDDVYVRDLHGRDSLLVRAMPGRPLWLVTADPSPGAVPRFVRLPVDSAWAAWRAGR